jgi:hypothetical protein
MKSEVYKGKVDARVELLAGILDAAARMKKREVNSCEKHAIFAHKLQSALILTVGFSKIDCKL